MASADNGDFVGSVKTAEGEARVERAGKLLSARAKMKLNIGDKLVTGPDGSMGILLRDNTSLSLGPKSELAIDEFLFTPAQSKLSLVARITRGTASYISGKIGRLSPKSVRLETPDATIGIRGTKLLIKVD